MSLLSETDLAMVASLEDSFNFPSPRVTRTTCDTMEADALLARMLQEELNGSADVTAMMANFGADETVQVNVARDSNGGAGFAFDRTNLKITVIKNNRADLLRALKIGDTITAVNGVNAATVADYTRLAQGVDRFRLTVRRVSLATVPTERQSTSRISNSRPRRNGSPAPVVQRRAPPRRARLPDDNVDVDHMSYEELLELCERQGDVRNPGLSDAAIERLPVEQVSCGGGGQECAICLEDFCDGEHAMRLPCLHTFHRDCACNWLRRQARCPFCNGEVAL